MPKIFLRSNKSLHQPEGRWFMSNSAQWMSFNSRPPLFISFILFYQQDIILTLRPFSGNFKLKIVTRYPMLVCIRLIAPHSAWQHVPYFKFTVDLHMISDKNPVALIFAGYNKVDTATKKKTIQEIKEAYDGEEIYVGDNKFLHQLAGRPVIQYVIDAVFNAKKNGKRLYSDIYVYNDVESFKQEIDVSLYPNLHVLQMKDSLGGHWKDFYFNYAEYGQRIDAFFGDTPRIKPDDVEYVNREYDRILGKVKDHRGVRCNLAFSVAEYEDLTDNWLDHRTRRAKRGKNKGKLKSFIAFEKYQARVGNTFGVYKTPGLDDLLRYEVTNLAYNLRKALAPSVISKIIYYLIKSKHLGVIKQIRNKRIVENDVYEAILDIIEQVYKIDLSNFAAILFHIKKNTARWENDIDGPHDLEIFQNKFKELKS